ncbi:hypothetical protein BU26DRAFT_183941 [Trematosphaeria pertusa]|uniref:Uncharacterized protein n=1 Tax=Trematosphaeria pertusa TaxID=390896 RepID=A0A6A6HSV1_9PLEO|nr:uncharacterized protein BU26DRAFT_183941 [Trematosphaeria pertusa]KAF2241255.1 hypothetical protein BU26DRAFT_183941 [Trematosphaeria pertusa]
MDINTAQAHHLRSQWSPRPDENAVGAEASLPRVSPQGYPRSAATRMFGERCWQNPEGGVPIGKCWRRRRRRRATKTRRQILTARPSAKETRRTLSEAGAVLKLQQVQCSAGRAVLARSSKAQTKSGDEAGRSKGSSQTTQRLRFGHLIALRCAGVLHDWSLVAHRTIWSRCRKK